MAVAACYLAAGLPSPVFSGIHSRHTPTCCQAIVKPCAACKHHSQAGAQLVAIQGVGVQDSVPPSLFAER